MELWAYSLEWVSWVWWKSYSGCGNVFKVSFIWELWITCQLYKEVKWLDLTWIWLGSDLDSTWIRLGSDLDLKWIWWKDVKLTITKQRFLFALFFCLAPEFSRIFSCTVRTPLLPALDLKPLLLINREFLGSEKFQCSTNRSAV